MFMLTYVTYAQPGGVRAIAEVAAPQNDSLEWAALPRHGRDRFAGGVSHRTPAVEITSPCSTCGPAELIFTTSADERVRLLRLAAWLLGLLGLCLYQRRRGGSSEDVVS